MPNIVKNPRVWIGPTLAALFGEFFTPAESVKNRTNFIV